ncbi:bifunctional DNA primase/polymerase [Amycolatopsis sp. NPDC059021]|uniref:bifunctional DNA primase/polymerase n=1 Tax=Amycolatopsis sp. NPDC059021 TaxID=3346704 RepID=UPI00366E11BD
MDTANSSAANPLREWALYAAGMGWHVFPLRPGTKIPTGHAEARCPGTGRCADGHQTPEKRATTDTAVIGDAWDRAPFNIGIATGPSGLVVIDCDMPKDGEDGPTGANRLEWLAGECGGPLPDTYTVTTPSGGIHRYYLAPPGSRLPSTKGKVCRLVDTRAWGGYVVGPGSVTEQGAYDLTDDRDPVELPGWLVQAIAESPSPAISAPVQIRSVAPSTYGSVALANECGRVRAAQPEQHNAVLSSAAYTIGRKVGAGLIDHATARADLITAAAHMVTASCDCTDREIARVVDAGLAAGARNPVAHRKDAA